MHNFFWNFRHFRFYTEVCDLTGTYLINSDRYIPDVFLLCSEHTIFSALFVEDVATVPQCIFSITVKYQTALIMCIHLGVLFH